MKYPKYDNCDAIEVSKVADIPRDYKGVMGVPITFLSSYCPDQFEILDARDYFTGKTFSTVPAPGQYVCTVDGKAKYARILIRRR